MNKFFERLKAVKAKQVVYPAITGALIAVVAFFFVLAAKFLSENINKSFALDESSAEAGLIKVDLPDYYLVAKKLGINVEISAPPPVPAAGTSAAPTSTAASSTTSNPSEDRKSLKIEVVNSVPVKGLATDLANQLNAAGFLVTKDSTPRTEAMTLIKAKGSEKNSPFLAEIRGIVSTKYAPAGTQTLPEDSPYDVVIIIGAR